MRTGWAADLAAVNGNPLENFKLPYPHSANAGVKPGIEWTVKGGASYSTQELMRGRFRTTSRRRPVRGIPYSTQELMREVKAIVDKAKNAAGGSNQ